MYIWGYKWALWRVAATYSPGWVSRQRSRYYSIYFRGSKHCEQTGPINKHITAINHNSVEGTFFIASSVLAQHSLMHSGRLNHPDQDWYIGGFVMELPSQETLVLKQAHVHLWQLHCYQQIQFYYNLTVVGIREWQRQHGDQSQTPERGQTEVCECTP